MTQTFNIFDYMKAQKKLEKKLDDAELCARYDGECTICPKKGKCRFRRR